MEGGNQEGISAGIWQAKITPVALQMIFSLRNLTYLGGG
jgi:hypothetical protein